MIVVLARVNHPAADPLRFRRGDYGESFEDLWPGAEKKRGLHGVVVRRFLRSS